MEEKLFQQEVVLDVDSFCNSSYAKAKAWSDSDIYINTHLL